MRNPNGVCIAFADRLVQIGDAVASLQEGGVSEKTANSENVTLLGASDTIAAQSASAHPLCSDSTSLLHFFVEHANLRLNSIASNLLLSQSASFRVCGLQILSAILAQNYVKRDFLRYIAQRLEDDSISVRELAIEMLGRSLLLLEAGSPLYAPLLDKIAACIKVQICAVSFRTSLWLSEEGHSRLWRSR